MLKRKIIKYFLDKPGAYDSEEQDILKLNVASHELGKLHKGTHLSLELKLERQALEHLKEKFRIEAINENASNLTCQIELNESMPIGDLYELLDLSYESLFNALPEEEKNELLDLEW
ncbi:MAG: hypothetical protein JXR88_10675 [Clostridia bacterium]|nr:hypothetical protein [Clostridia bacterium]